MTEVVSVIPAEANKDEIIFDLSDGRKCKVIAGTGNHSKIAQRFIKDLAGAEREEAYRFELMAAVTFIDDKPIIKDTLLGLKLKDFHDVQGAFAELNF